MSTSSRSARLMRNSSPGDSFERAQVWTKILTQLQKISSIRQRAAVVDEEANKGQGNLMQGRSLYG